MTLTPDTVVDRPETQTPDDEVAHILTKEDQMRGYIEGIEVQALCGHRFVPTKDYEGLPVCSECSKIREQIRNGAQN